MINTPRTKNVKFSVVRKKPLSFKPNSEDKRVIQFFSESILKHFAMSEDLAKAIGTVVVQALTENAKTESQDTDMGFGGGEDDLDFGDDDDLGFGTDLDESELPESSRDSGKVKEAEGPKPAPDLSEDFAELKRTMNNGSQNMSMSDNSRRLKDIFSYSEKSYML